MEGYPKKDANKADGKGSVEVTCCGCASALFTDRKPEDRTLGSDPFKQIRCVPLPAATRQPGADAQVSSITPSLLR